MHYLSQFILDSSIKLPVPFDGCSGHPFSALDDEEVNVVGHRCGLELGLVRRQSDDFVNVISRDYEKDLLAGVKRKTAIIQ